jgi:hypothetical protein
MINIKPSTSKLFGESCKAINSSRKMNNRNPIEIVKQGSGHGSTLFDNLRLEKRLLLFKAVLLRKCHPRSEGARNKQLPALRVALAAHYAKEPNNYALAHNAQAA